MSSVQQNVPSKQAISRTSIPINDPSTPLSPALYKFIFLLIALVILLWFIKWIVRAKKASVLWKSVKDETVIRVEGPGSALITRDSLNALLRARIIHRIEDVPRVTMPAHVEVKDESCKIARESNNAASSVGGGAKTPCYVLTIPITSTGQQAVQAEVYVGVTRKAVNALVNGETKGLSAATKKNGNKRVAKPTPQKPQTQQHHSQHHVDIEQKDARLTSPSIELPTLNPSHNRNGDGGTDSPPTDPTEATSFLTSSHQQVTDALTPIWNVRGERERDGCVWRSASIIVQASPPTATADSSDASSSSFRQTVSVSIPCEILQRAYHDCVESATSSPSSSNALCPLVIHLRTHASPSSSIGMDEVTLGEIPSTLTSDTAYAIAASSSSVASEDAFLVKIKFERQFMIVSSEDIIDQQAFIASATKSSLTPIMVYELQDLFGLPPPNKLREVHSTNSASATALPPSVTQSPSHSSDPSTSDDATTSECLACMSEVKDIILLPCRHVCICHTCHANVARCPICREKLQAHLKFVEPKEIKARHKGEHRDGAGKKKRASATRR